MPAVLARRWSHSTPRAFASIRDFSHRCPRRPKQQVYESWSAERQRAKKQKRTRKTFRRSPAKTRTPLTTLKQKHGACLSAANSRLKKPKNCERVSRQQV